jgi:hypothetical protein
MAKKLVVNSHQELAIEEIDLQLYRYGIILDVDKNNYFVDVKKRTIQKLKYYGVRLLFLVHIVRHIFFIIKAKKGIVPIDYLDMSQYLGVLPQFARINVLLCLLLVFGIINLFNNNSNIYVQFFDILKVLKGLEPKELIEIYDENEMNNFRRKVKAFKKIIDYGVPVSAVTLTLMVISTVTANYYPSHIKDGILSGIMFLSWGYISVIVLFNGFIYFFIICVYCKIRFKIFNKEMPGINLKEFMRFKNADQIVVEINGNCKNISRHNKFWRKYFFVLTFTLLPLNLSDIQQMVFSELPLIIFIFMIFFCIGSLIAHYMINLVTASVNREARKSHKLLFKFYVENNRSMNLNQKIKVNSI